MKAIGYGIIAAVTVLTAGTAVGIAMAYRTSSAASDRHHTFEISEVQQPVFGTTSTTETAAVDYVLRTYGFGLGLFRADENIPFACVEAELSCLPECDLAALRAGIHTESEAELWRMVEDFTS